MPRPHCNASIRSHGRAGIVLALLQVAAMATAQEKTPRQPSEADSRAALLRTMMVLRIAPYLLLVEPPAARKEYRIGVVGDDAVAAAIRKELPGKKVGDLPVVVVVITVADATQVAPAHGCDLLWLANSIDAPTHQRIVTNHADRPTALIGERDGFAASGGSVQLFVQENSLKFEVNAESLRAKGMRASPQLLKLSRKGPGA
jgi:hypothetical protein